MTGTCGAGSSIRVISATGTVTCETDDVGITTETDPKVGSITLNYVPKWNGTALSNGLIYDSGSLVGIGTSSPGAPLHVRTGSDVVSILESTDATAALEITDPDGTVAVRSSGGNMLFGVGGYEVMYEKARITPDGKVGIGTTSPAYKLDIAGSANLNNGVSSGIALLVNGKEALWSDGNYFSWGWGGNANAFDDSVGIGVYPPYTSKLTVAGTIESTSGGIKFPDGTIQTTAAAPSWHQILPAAERFVLVMNNNEAVLDKETGLVWQKSPSSILRAWSTSITYCATLNAGGRMGWHLPTREQLASLVDPTQTNPSLPSGHLFSNVQSSFYWSANTSAYNPAFAWGVSFSDGSVSYLGDKTDSSYAWCVRGGQSHDSYAY